MENREFYLDHDGIRLHAKLDFPTETKRAGKSVEQSEGKSEGKSAEKLPLLILAHGFTGHMEEPHITGIKDAVTGHGYAVLRIEMYGHGSSGGDFRDHTQLKWISELIYVIGYARKLDFVSDLYLAGHSAGGLATIVTGAVMADVLKAIMPLAPALNIWDQTRKGRMLDIEFDPENVPEELDFGEGNILGGDYLRTARFLPVEEAIDAFKKPVLIVHGDADETVPVSYALWAAERYENCTLKIIPGDDHCYDYHLDQVTAAILEFLDSIR